MNRHALSSFAAPLTALFVLGAGCSTLEVPSLPGESNFAVGELRFEGNTQLEPGPLAQAVAVRPDGLLIPGQPYNPYRLAEDRRRVAAFWTSHGFFEVEVSEAEVSFDDDAKEVDVTWHIDEGPRYTIRRVELRSAPAAWREDMEEAIPFGPGDDIDLQAYRMSRHRLADVLRHAGHMRAEVVTRAFIDREAKRVDWFYYADPGPETVVGEVTVEGHDAVDAEAIRDRAGLRPGQPLALGTIQKREMDLLDTGAFANARLYAELDTEFITGAVPADSWIPPDTGGLVAPEQIGPDGELLPREGLAPEVDLAITVVEAPSVSGEVQLGVYADTERVDPGIGTKLTLRNAFGSLHHLTFDGSLGYGVRWRGDVDGPLGLYGTVGATYVKPMAFGRLVDLTLGVRFEEEPYPGFHWRTARAKLGFRAALAEGLFLRVAPLFRFDWPVGVGAIDAATRDDLDLAELGRSANTELTMSLVWDAREPRLEALRGHLVSLRAAYAPGGPLGDHGWVRPELDLRYIINLNADMAVALRSSWGWVFDVAGDGVPIGARLFGGGAYGARGFGRRRLATYTDACDGVDCRAIPVGGASLSENALELRWLPYRQQIGAVAFVDVAGAGEGANPFEDGVSVAPGLGLRLRLWHFHLAFDFSYRVTDVPAFDDLDRFFVFVRFGEAF